MIKKIHFLLLFPLLIVLNANATVRTLNNNNPSPGQFTTWTSVQAVCNPGDTVYINGSENSYGNITVSVYNLTLIGTGFNPQKQNPLISKLDTVEFTVAKITLNGLKIKQVSQLFNIGVSDVTIENCHTTFLAFSYYDVYCKFHNDIFISEGSFSPIFFSFLTTYNAEPAFHCDMKNCVLFGGIYLNGSLSYLKTSNFTNNIFIRHTIPNYGFTHTIISATSFSDITFNNNIVYGLYSFTYTPATYTNVNCANNLIFDAVNSFTSFPNDNGTTIIGNPLLNSICPTYCGYSFTDDYHTASNSIAKNAGTDGTDIGVYGGIASNIFNPSGEPKIPQVKVMNMPASGFQGANFNVTVTSTVK